MYFPVARMKIVDAQRWIHRVNTTAAILLLFTGTMHTLPDIRSSLFGGYDRLIADIHVWTGVVFISFPLLALARTQGSLLKNLQVRIFKDPIWHWRRFHLTLTVSVCLIQALAGTMIWIDIFWQLPLMLVDSLFLIHRMGAWYIGLMLPLHLWMARRSIAKIVRKLIGVEPSPV